MKDYSYIFNAHPSYIDQLYQNYLQDPQSVEEGWRVFFEGFEFQDNNIFGGAKASASDMGGQIAEEFAVQSIIHGYRQRGHLLSTTNPVRSRKDRMPNPDLSNYGLNESHLSQKFRAGEEIGLKDATLSQILDRLNHIYCGNIGFEYSFIENNDRRKWLRDKIEKMPPSTDYGVSLDNKKRILEKLNGASVFEKFLHTKYIGQKRFSLEGGEGAIPALDYAITSGAALGVKEVVIGMAHRGRLNVLANIMGKTYEQIFHEFEENVNPEQVFGDGDVKYHLGYSSQLTTPQGDKVDVKLAPNPSHLEAVNTVVGGFSRAKADILYDSQYDHILPILIHGDAAIAGQGIVYETVQMSQLEGYNVGGTLHFVINNQVGFTTDFTDARSSTYCTSIASIVQAPVFHVNGDDPEALVFAIGLAMEYRQKFNSDIFIDMVCYRKHGHNEGDDPNFTQPELYKLIKAHPGPREVYVKELIERGDVDKSLAEQMEKQFWGELQDRLDEMKQKELPYKYQEPEKAWRKLTKYASPEDMLHSPKTGVTQKTINSTIDNLMSLPDDFTPMSKVNRLIKGMQKLWKNKELNWGMAELLAYGTLLQEGYNVRMSGQDVKRGTFSHRHAVFYDDKDYTPYYRLNNFSEDQGEMMIYNSLLSEFGVLGFEFGYSMATPETLVLWEAQFGDFYNGAQVMVDQFISSSESKWQRMSGLVMLLPHGYEGQGPEHSSARLERFLQMCAEGNMTVVNCSTPANIFHVLRRQLYRDFRKPLVVMSPKSLLRHPACISTIDDVKTNTQFELVYEDTQIKPSKSVKKIVLCTGKVYYDLIGYRDEHKIKDTAVIRVEQLYPFPKKMVGDILAQYKNTEVRWVQEEPRNMGAATFVNERIELDAIISRKASASPAGGFKKVHEVEQKDLMARAFG